MRDLPKPRFMDTPMPSEEWAEIREANVADLAKRHGSYLKMTLRDLLDLLPQLDEFQRQHNAQALAYEWTDEQLQQALETYKAVETLGYVAELVERASLTSQMYCVHREDIERFIAWRAEEHREEVPSELNA